MNSSASCQGVMLIGTTLGHYRIVEKIGEGGMGVVYRARDERLDRDVAVKVLPASVAQDPERIARFEREAKAVARLDHPNILAIKVPGTWVLMFCQFSRNLTLTPGRDRCARGSESRRIRSVAWERSHPGVRFRWVRVLSRTLPRRELSGFLGHH